VAFGVFVSTRIEPTSAAITAMSAETKSAVIGCQRFRADPI
jgi:hypothetical protein